MMNRFRYFIHLLTICILLTLFLANGTKKSEALPSSTVQQQGQNFQVYLPLTVKGCIGKCWSGMHLGNRNNADWNGLLNRIDPDLGGKWPPVVVALSSQVYDIQRYPSNHPQYPCRVSSASIKPTATTLFDYIRRASASGVRVIIRIFPSPGNFVDWDDPNHQNHQLSSGPPVGPDGYCGWQNYRSPLDLVDEMRRIQDLNRTYGFIVFGFEPANEPNIEWYSFTTAPAIFNSTAWQQMDDYFSTVYDWSLNYQYINVLTPPMAQSAYAEGIDIDDVDAAPTCEARLLDNGQTGYDMMRTTYETKSYGINWHNYWILGKEIYASCPNGQHVSLYFPFWLKNAISNQGKPTTVTEADLASPSQMYGLNSLPDKESGNNPALADDSIRHFFQSEHHFGGANFGVPPFVALWLLADNTGFGDHDWHEAYQENGGITERTWFTLWYPREDTWP